MSRISRDNLQVANGGFLEIIAAGIGVETSAPCVRHADDVRGLVQHRVQRSVVADEDAFAGDTGLRRTPEGAGYARAIGDEFEPDAVAF